MTNLPPAPTVGRIVHYVSYGTPGGEYPSTCRAAVVTEVPAGATSGDVPLGLAVLNPTGMFFNRAVSYHDGTPERVYPGGTWHWPERT